MKKTSLFLLRIYKQLFSLTLKLFFGGGCRYRPTCSEYAHQAIDKFGVAKGTSLSISRVLRCHPFAKGGFDPVPAK